MVILFITLLFVRIATRQSSRTGALQHEQEPPKYDFWDDSLFANLYKQSYQGFKRNIQRNTTADKCVQSCLNSDTCVSLLYNAKEQMCETLPINLVANHPMQDSTIVRKRYNHYYRYLPPGAADFCPMSKCFHYNRVVKTCWKIILEGGPRSRHLYRYDDAVAACAKEGAQLASINTQLKLQQLNLMLKNFFYALVNPKDLWRWVWIGGRRRVKKSGVPFTWEAGGRLKTDNRTWAGRFYSLSYRTPNDCVVLTGYKRTGKNQFREYRFSPAKCHFNYAGVLCEIRPPSFLVDQSKVLEYRLDPHFKNIRKMFFRGRPKPSFRTNYDLDECARACTASATCVSFFFFAFLNACHLLPFNLVVNATADNSMAKVKPGAYYRYDGPDGDFCPKEKQFFFDQKTRLCIRIFSGAGPRGDKKYRMSDTDSCTQLGGQPASLDTVAKFKKLDLFLKNHPILAPKEGKWWKWLWSGALRGTDGVYRWPNNNPVDISEQGIWVEDPSVGISRNYSCAFIRHYAPSVRSKPTEYRNFQSGKKREVQREVPQGASPVFLPDSPLRF